MTKDVIHGHNSPTPRLHFSSSPSSFVFFSLFGFCCDFPSLQQCMAIYRKQLRSARKFAQANCGLMVKASTPQDELLDYGWIYIFSPGELDASLSEFRVRNLCEKTILPCHLALFLNLTNNHQIPIKSWRNLSYLNKNISKYSIYINN